MPVISKRKLESYKRAEELAREMRAQIADRRKENPNVLAELVIRWMLVTGNIKWERPKHRETREEKILRDLGISPPPQSDKGDKG